MTAQIGQTGGAGRHWLYDPTNVPEPIAEKLVNYDKHSDDGPSFETMLAIVVDQLLLELPPEQEEAVRLLHLAGLTQRAAGRTIGVDHHTVKARAKKGLDSLRRRMQDSVWLADLLRGQIPEETTPVAVSGERMVSVLDALRGGRDE